VVLTVMCRRRVRVAASVRSAALAHCRVVSVVAEPAKDHSRQAVQHRSRPRKPQLVPVPVLMVATEQLHMVERQVWVGRWGKTQPVARQRHHHDRMPEHPWRRQQAQQHTRPAAAPALTTLVVPKALAVAHRSWWAGAGLFVLACCCLQSLAQADMTMRRGPGVTLMQPDLPLLRLAQRLLIQTF